MRAELLSVDLDGVDHQVGLIAPEMSMLQVRDYLGSNEKQLEVIRDFFKVSSADLEDSYFAAGSMFFIRASCLKSFEERLPKIRDLLSEEGYRIDGSYAHAMERCMQFFAYRTGFSMCSSRTVAQC